MRLAMDAFMSILLFCVNTNEKAAKMRAAGWGGKYSRIFLAAVL
jgi:hypothetical protein